MHQVTHYIITSRIYLFGYYIGLSEIIPSLATYVYHYFTHLHICTPNVTHVTHTAHIAHSIHSIGT